MDVLRQILLVLHIVGIGALLGGFLTQLGRIGSGEVRIVPAMTHGALTMLVTGFAMVAVIQSGLHGDLDNTKIGTKIAILVVVLLLTWANREKRRVDVRVYGAIGVLTVANVAIAVMWN